MIVRALLTASVIAALTPPAARAEPRAHTTSDAPNLRGAFVIHNPRGNPTIRYSVKWGKNGKWEPCTLKPGHKYTHSYPLKQNRAPAPYVRFDNVGGDGKVTNRTVAVEFGRVGYTGYGRKGDVNEAWHYEFRYGKDGRHLALNER